jgi:hypothetical protein
MDSTMTTNRARKLAIRERMATVGVSYAEAATRLADQNDAPAGREQALDGIHLGWGSEASAPLYWVASPTSSALWLDNGDSSTATELLEAIGRQRPTDRCHCWRWTLPPRADSVARGSAFESLKINVEQVLPRLAWRPTERAYLLLDGLADALVDPAMSMPAVEWVVAALLRIAREGHACQTHLVVITREAPGPRRRYSRLVTELRAASTVVDAGAIAPFTPDEGLLPAPCWEIWREGTEESLDRHFPGEEDASAWLTKHGQALRPGRWEPTRNRRGCAELRCVDCGEYVENDTGGPLHVWTRSQYLDALRSDENGLAPGEDGLLRCSWCQLARELPEEHSLSESNPEPPALPM